MSEKKIEAAKRQYVHNRNWRRARDRALVKLARMHSDEYRELLDREKANDEAQGRKWIDIDGTTNTVGVGPTITPIAGVREASNGGKNQGNNGGEE